MFRLLAEVLFRGQLRLNSPWWYNKQPCKQQDFWRVRLLFKSYCLHCITTESSTSVDPWGGLWQEVETLGSALTNILPVGTGKCVIILIIHSREWLDLFVVCSWSVNVVDGTLLIVAHALGTPTHNVLFEHLFDYKYIYGIWILEVRGVAWCMYGYWS